MNDLKCLSEQELSEFVQGRIDDLRVEQIAEHLEACDDCQATVVMLGERSDTFVEQLRSPAVSDALEAENACQAAVERLAARAANGYSDAMTTMPDVSEIAQLGPYRMRGQLGVGGMGAVYEAVHTKLKRTVALKLLPASRWTNPLAIARFEREMEIIGQLDHPNIVRASDAGEEHGMHYLVMEHVDGLDLSRVVNRLGSLAIADACEIARQAAIGLQYASENGLVHRDIKPSNLMLAGSGKRSAVSSQPERQQTTVKILDLGLALLNEAHSPHENELTTVGQLMGTLDYMSPEQGMDSHEVDTRADVYSLGATLFKLLTGRAPFASPQYNTLLKKVTALANKPVTPIKQLRADIPDELASIIDRMLAKDPGERFSTPNEAALALEPFTRGADLGGLLVEALNAKEPESRSQPPVIRSRDIPWTSLAAPKATQPKSRLAIGIFAGLLVVLILLAVAAGIVIRISTDKGELIVRAEQDAQIVVRKNGNIVEQFEVAKGEHAITVRSGGYEIELEGQSDELMVSQNSVTIKRGERVVVHIQHRPKPAGALGSQGGMGAEMAGATGGDMGMYGASGGMDRMYGGAIGEEMYSGMMGAGVPTERPATFDGKTYKQWLSELETERKPERLTDAVRAFASLGEDDRELATRSVAVIMQIMRRNGSNVIDDTPRGKLIQQTLEVMLKMPSDVVIAAAEEELRDGNTRSRSFVNYLLQYAFNGQGSPQSDFQKTIERRRTALYELLLTLPEEEDANVRASALSLVIDRAKWHSADLGEVEGLLPRLRTAIREKELKLVALGARSLTKLEPDNKDLVPALIRLVSSNDNDQRVDAIRLLGRLGARAQPAIDRLVEIIRPIAEPKPSSPGAADASAAYGGGFGGGMGGFGGGGYGGGGYGGGYSPYRDIQYVAIEAIGKMGTAAKPCMPLLRKIAESLPITSPLSAAGGSEMGAGFEGSGEEELYDIRSEYIEAAKTAIARIEGREPIPTPAEEDAADAFRPPGGGGFF